MLSKTFANIDKLDNAIFFISFVLPMTMFAIAGYICALVSGNDRIAIFLAIVGVIYSIVSVAIVSKPDEELPE